LFLFKLRLVAEVVTDFKQAQAQFERILAIDPYRIEDIDIYSNILYVTDCRLKLSRLANDFLTLDRDRPEVCCLVGMEVICTYVGQLIVPQATFIP
jgi:hypothetical protein